MFLITTTTSRWIIVAVFLLFDNSGVSWESCSGSEPELHGNNSFCPDGNTCCLSSDGLTGCIAADLGRENATCCEDDTTTGCGVDYSCTPDGQCASDTADPLTSVLPRYQLCSVDAVPRELFALDVNGSQLPYFSSLGSLDNLSNGPKVDTLCVVIHGSGRNADDYYCSMLSAARDQGKVLVLAPAFLLDNDPGIFPPNSLRWSEDGNGGGWRYGKDSLSGISSFRAMDDLIQRALGQIQQQFTTIPRVRIVGHSAGGQFVQRWALTSSIWVDRIFRGVVANPSSYAYLEDLRFIHDDSDDGGWMIPADCPRYNTWEWGLTLGNATGLAYIRNTLEKFGIVGMRQRFSTRDVVYLAGGQDRCNVTEQQRDGWCFSHGLETTCMDRAQGEHRLERHQRYIESLKRLGLPHSHGVVNGVGHDHSLMFNSPTGLAAIFGTIKDSVHIS